MNLIAEEDEHESLPEGIESFNHETEEFSLKPNVIKNFSIAFELAVEAGTFIKIKPLSLVRSLDETSIFICEKGKFRSVKVKIENAPT